MHTEALSALGDLFGGRLQTSLETRICYSFDATRKMFLPDAVFQIAPGSLSGTRVARSDRSIKGGFVLPFRERIRRAGPIPIGELGLQARHTCRRCALTAAPLCTQARAPCRGTTWQLSQPATCCCSRAAVLTTSPIAV